ncbi:MAG TPA: TonB-dependent receptor [Bacteroidales bacterium]|nr:TonB-dependent receptor [Bacteroidales bacterium]
MKKIFIIFLFITGFYLNTYSQKLFIADQKTGQPIENVTISSKKPFAIAITNVKGETEISAFSGSEKIEIRHLGYKTEYRSYTELGKDEYKLFMKPVGVSLDEVVVSATKWSQRANDIPGKIAIIQPKEIQLQNPQTAADMLAASGKVFIQKSQQGGGSPMIRGFATNRLLYTVDGIRMNTAIFRAGNIQNVISLDPFAIEEAEVFFGPGSVIYGSDAIGGVMSFQTLTPQLSATDKPLITGNTVSRYSSANNEITAHLDIGVGWKKWSLLSSISTSKFGDLKMGSHGPDVYLRPFYVQRQDSLDVVVTNTDTRVQRPSGYSQINMMQKIRFKPNNKWDIQYGFHYSVTSEYSRYDRHVRYKKGLPRYGEWYYGPQKWMMNSLNVTHNSNNKVYDQMTIRLAWQSFEESRIDRDFNKNDRHIRVENVEAYSGNIDFNKSVGKRHEFFYGFEVVYDDVKSTGEDEDISTGDVVAGPSRYPRSSWSSYAAYLNYQFKISEKVLLQSGIRYNHYLLDATFDTTFYHFPYTKANISKGALTGSLGVVYHPTEKWALSMNISTGFRSPNVDDMGKMFDPGDAIVVVPNPDLKAEYAYNGEIGIVKIFGDIIKIDLTGYYTYLKDAMVRRVFKFNGLDSIIYDGTLSQVEALQNAASANVFGVQAGFEVKLPVGFGFSSDFNYQKGIEELDDGTKSPSRHAAPWTGVSRLSYTYSKLTLQLYSVYSGGKKFKDLPEEEKGKPEIYAVDDEGNPYSPGWYTLNFKAMYQFIDNLSVSAGLENITDQRYRPYSSGIVAPGINFIFSLKAKF